MKMSSRLRASKGKGHSSTPLPWSHPESHSQGGDGRPWEERGHQTWEVCIPESFLSSPHRQHDRTTLLY